MNLPLTTRLAILLLLLNLAACKKDKEINPPSTPATCLTTKMERQDESFSTYQYDAANRISSIYNHSPKNQFADEINETVTITRNGQNQPIKMVGDRGNSNGTSTRTLDYDSKGQLIKNTYSNTPKIYQNYSTVFEYNNQGLIIKTTITYNGDSSYLESYTYEYTNGNLTKRTTGDEAFTAYFEYYTDKEAIRSEAESLNAITGVVFSSPSKNLLKKINDGGFVWEYTYEFNEKGFVTKAIVQYSFDGTPGSQSTLTYTYTCN